MSISVTSKFKIGLINQFHLYDYDASGHISRDLVVNGVAAWRLLKKQASQATVPGRRGVFTSPTNYFCEWGSIRYRPGEMRYQANKFLNAYRLAPEALPTSKYGRSPSSLYSTSANLWNMLEVKALNKLKHSDVNVGVAIAEAKETEHLLTSSATRIANTNLGLPRSIRSAARRFCGVNPKKVPQQYLEVMYGWNPLLSDIVGACESLGRSGQEGFLVQVRVSKRTSGQVQPEIIHALGSQRGSSTYRADQAVVLRYRLTNATLAQLLLFSFLPNTLW